MTKLKAKKHSDRFYLLLLLLVVSLPFSPALAGFFTGVLFLNAFTAPKKSWRESHFGHPLIIGYLAFFGAYLISLSYSENLVYGLRNIETKLSFLIMPFVLALSAKDITAQRKKFLLGSFIISVMAAAVFSIISGIYDYLSTGSWYSYYESGLVRDHHLFYTGLSYPLMHPGYFSVYVGTAIFIIWQCFLKTPKRWLPIASILFLLGFLLLLQGRINILAFALIAAAFLTIELVQTKYYKLLIGAAVAGILVAAVLVPLLPPHVKDRFTESTSLEYEIDAGSIEDFSGLTIRFAEWHSIIPVLKENPITGVGVGDSFEETMESYEEENFVVGLQRKFNSHNQYLQTYLATGIFGLIPLLGLFIIFIKISIKNKDKLLVITTLYFFLSMITESMLERYWAVGFFCSILLFLGLTSRPHHKKQTIKESKE